MSALQRRLFDNCRNSGWDPHLVNTFAEAFRAFRQYHDFEIHNEDGKPTGVPVELADVAIGLFYNAELHGFDLLDAITRKHAYNLTRDYMGEGRQLHPTPDNPQRETP